MITDICLKMFIVVPENIPYQPQGRLLEILRGRGVSKANIFKGKYEAKLENQGGWSEGVQTKKPSVVGGGGGYGYFMEPHLVNTFG